MAAISVQPDRQLCYEIDVLNQRIVRLFIDGQLVGEQGPSYHLGEPITAEEYRDTDLSLEGYVAYRKRLRAKQKTPVGASRFCRRCGRIKTPAEYCECVTHEEMAKAEAILRRE